GSMGRALPGVSLAVLDGELTADPASVPTFFLGYLGEDVRRASEDELAGAEGFALRARGGSEAGAWIVADRASGGEGWRTGDRGREDREGYLYFAGGGG